VGYILIVSGLMIAAITLAVFLSLDVPNYEEEDDGAD
jgi:hypothetical protein